MTPFTALAASALLIPTVTLVAGFPPPQGGHTSARSRPSSSPSSTLLPSTSTPAGKWNWPLLPAPTVVRGFQVGPLQWSAGHRGVDLAARPGAAVRAPANGTVFFAGVLAGRPVLSIDHGGGLISSFEPVISRFPKGAVVSRGQVVGDLSAGPTHCLPAVCLHWGVRKNGRYLDPLTLLPARPGPAVLLPMLP